MARSSSELYMMARTPRRIGANSERPSADSRSAVGTSTARSRQRASQVIGGVVAEAEPEHDVELVTRARDAADERRAHGPWRVEPLELVVEGMRLA